MLRSPGKDPMSHARVRSFAVFEKFDWHVCLSATRSLAFVSIATCDALATAKRKSDQWLQWLSGS